jgi:four helix bundle protein
MECWSDGVMGKENATLRLTHTESATLYFFTGLTTTNYRNKNHGYQQLRVWEDAMDYFVTNCKVFRNMPFDLKRVASQAISSADSIHRNIAEGYCRRSIKEYLNFLNIALGSLGESVSGLQVYKKAQILPEPDFIELDALSFKLENGLLKLVESLERKQMTGDWIDHLVIQETNAAYNCTPSAP